MGMVHRMMGEVLSLQAGTARHWGEGEGGISLGHDQGCPVSSFKYSALMDEIPPSLSLPFVGLGSLCFIGWSCSLLNSQPGLAVCNPCIPCVTGAR